MRLGLALSGRRSAREAVELAERAEALGFHEVWVTEDYCERGAFTLAGAVAAATRRVGVGVGTVNPWTRHPVLIAMEFAALSEVAGERVWLGLGASNRVWMEEELGIAFERPLERLGEAVGLIRGALTGQAVEHAGPVFQVSVRPSASVGRSRIVLGVKGKRALRMAGEVADGVLLSLLSSAEYVAWATRQIGRALPLRSYVLFASHAERGAALETIRHHLARYLGVHGDHEITRVAGLDEEQARSFRRGWLEGKPPVHLVDQRLAETFAVAGTPEECAQGMSRLYRAGLETVIVWDHGGGDPGELLDAASRAFLMAGGRLGRG